MNYVLIVILIMFSAFFSGTEIAYTSVNRVRLKKMAEDGSRVAGLAVKLSDRFETALTAILVGNNFVNIGASAVSTTIAIGIAATFDNESAQSLAVTVSTVIITILILIGASAILTGLNIYQKIGNKCGAGALVPITGFANSVAASAIEFKVEGQVFGIGCQIFRIAGPVILYGVSASVVYGLIYWITTLF